MSTQTDNGQRAIRRRVVEGKAGFGKTTLYALIASGRFPKPIRIGKRSVAWIEAEVDAWLAQRTRERDKEAA